MARKTAGVGGELWTTGRVLMALAWLGSGACEGHESPSSPGLPETAPSAPDAAAPDATPDAGTGAESDATEPTGLPEEGHAVRQCSNEQPAPVFCGDRCEAIENNGPPWNRVSLVLIGDGFTEAELSATYAPHARALADYMFTNEFDSQPYVTYRRFINFYRIDLPSPESGVDQPSQGVWVNTPLDGEDGCTDWRVGMCQVNWEKTHDALDAALAGSEVDHIDWRLVTLNTVQACGMTHYPSRGRLAVYCPFNPESLDVALHEGGHGFHGLADTYWTRTERYVGAEPEEPNLSTDESGAKWARWLGYQDPILGIIDAYEGGGQYAYGLFRPSYNSKMGSAEYCHAPGPPYCPHDAVSREQIILDISALVSPLDAWMADPPQGETVTELWVDVVDCEVITVDWYVDGELVAPDFGEVFVPSDHGVQPGAHRIMAQAYDATEEVRLDRSSLKKWVSWEVVVD